MIFMEKMTKNEGLLEAIAQYRTLKAFSAALDVKYQVVQQWLINGVPPEYCPKIEKLTRVRSESLNDRVDWKFIRSQPDLDSHRNDDSGLSSPHKPPSG